VRAHLEEQQRLAQAPRAAVRLYESTVRGGAGADAARAVQLPHQRQAVPQGRAQLSWRINSGSRGTFTLTVAA